MNNIVKFDYCFGCGVCSAVCPKKIISIRLNKEGFYAPVIDKYEDCVYCGACLDICAFNHKGLAIETGPLKCWAAWSNDEHVRYDCSSGGAGFEIGKQLIEQGYKAIGCRYDTKKQRAEHYVATTVNDFIQSIGSKYIQSFTEEAFKQIDRKQKYVFFGTPCQVDSLRRMVKKYKCEENFVLVDFFCHCVPSMYLWNAYLKMQKAITGDVKIARWRNKNKVGWHDSWVMIIEGEKGEIRSRMSQGDLFYQLFLGDVCHGKQCEKDCKYKYEKSSADIRIGDLWGTTYNNDRHGVSALVAFTRKGKLIVESLNNITLVEHSFDVVAEGQMKKNVNHKVLSPAIMFMLKHNYSLTGLTFRVTLFIQKVLTKIYSLL